MYTRFHDDERRMRKAVQQSSYTGDYYLSTPGQGMSLPFVADPAVRLTHWGGNLLQDSVDIESVLRCQTQPLTHDVVMPPSPALVPLLSVVEDASTRCEDSRATHPAWMYRSVEHAVWESPFLNPQAHLEKPFHTNLQTRLLEKDMFANTKRS